MNGCRPVPLARFGPLAAEAVAQYGEFNFGLVKNFFRQFAPSEETEGFASKTALDWGCGGGANMSALCRHFRRVVGVDISQPTLDECTRQLNRSGLSNFETALVDAARPRKVLDGVGRDAVDFFFSVAVFQHFPSKAYTKEVLETAAGLMCAGGVWPRAGALFRRVGKLRQKEGDYAKNVI